MTFLFKKEEAWISPGLFFFVCLTPTQSVQCELLNLHNNTKKQPSSEPDEGLTISSSDVPACALVIVCETSP